VHRRLFECSCTKETDKKSVVVIAFGKNWIIANVRYVSEKQASVLGKYCEIQFTRIRYDRVERRGTTKII
uniref:hypothetical protein n=1 Tax=Pseudomonas sp. 67(2021) TaxID=2813562 RepID=UPI001A9F28FA